MLETNKATILTKNYNSQPWGIAKSKMVYIMNPGMVHAKNAIGIGPLQAENSVFAHVRGNQGDGLQVQGHEDGEDEV